jgi:hypothetical protein
LQMLRTCTPLWITVPSPITTSCPMNTCG